MTWSDARLGTQIAGYRIDAILGHGGMSVVYLAEDLRLNRQIALKILTPELSNDERFRERFVRESRIAARLEHPNIVPIYEAGEADGHLYLAMRYIRGTDLHRLIRDEGALDPTRAVRIVRRAASALDAAHAEGLVHRDVKPANILLVPGGDEDGNDLVYLSDFGLTKRPETRDALTQTGQFVGTVEYVAPEQIEGKAVDARTDVYSLACVLFESLTGGTPFARDADVATLFAHLREKPPHLDELRPDLPASLDKIVQRGLAKSPEARYPSCGALAQDARDALGVASGGDSTIATRPPPRRGALVPIAAVVIGALAVLAAVVALAGNGGAPSHAAVDSPSASPAASATPTYATLARTPTSDERRLLDFIPEAFRADCGPFAPSPPAALATIACNTSSARVIYELFSTMPDTDHAFDQQRLVVSPPAGDCSSDVTAEGTYSVAGTRAGRVLCFLNEGRAVIAWTDDRALVFAQATRDDGADRSLYGWWRNSAGPLVPDASGGLTLHKDGPATAPTLQGTYLASVTHGEATSAPLRFQTTKLGTDVPTGWIGTWMLSLDGTSYSVRHSEETIESGTIGMAKHNRIVFTAATGACAGGAPAVYGVTTTGAELRWSEPEGSGDCLAGPWPLNAHTWSGLPTSTPFLFGEQDSLFLTSLASPGTSTIASDAISGSWSPDGSEVAFSDRAHRPDRLSIIGVDGSDRRFVTSTEVEQLDVAWSPDGRWIAYHQDDPNRRTSLVIVHPDGTGLRTLYTSRGNVGRPSWSGDSRELAFRDDTTIYVMGVDGGGLHRIVTDQNVGDTPTTWTPDGRIFFWGDALGASGIYSITPSGKDLRLVFESPGQEGVLVPDVSPDGQWMLLAGEWDTPEPLYLVDLRNGASFELITTATVAEARWRPETGGAGT
jgi:serine/threonine protein kinase